MFPVRNGFSSSAAGHLDNIHNRFICIHSTGFCSCLSLLLLLLSFFFGTESKAVILWSDLGSTLAHETADGTDILGGAIQQGGNSTNTLYFKFRVDPLSDVGVEPYFSSFQLYENGIERMAIGNSLKAWAYTAFNTSTTGISNRVYGDLDLNSSHPEPSGYHFEFPRHGFESTFVIKVEYVPGDDAYVTLWLNPDLGPGATEQRQDTNLITHFRANAAFNEIHLRHGGGGPGWVYSDMAIGTTFEDFVSETGSGHNGMAFNFRFWQREQGLPLGAIHALTQTQDGFIWLGGDNGVARFDGVRFVFLGSREGAGSGGIQTMLGDSEGSLWMGGNGTGLIRLENGKSTTYRTKDGIPSDTVTCLAEDVQKQIWIGTESGLSTYRNKKIDPLPIMHDFDGFRISALFQDFHNRMWVCVKNRGVFRLEEGTFVQIPDTGPEHLLASAHCILIDNKERIWIGAGDDFVLCRDGDRWLRYQLPHHQGTPYVTALAEEQDGSVWAGSVSEGLFHFREGRLSPVYAGSGLSDNLVESLLVDREGKLWVGTDAGLNRILPKRIISYGQNQGLGTGAVQGLAEVAPGIVWAGKPGGGLYSWDGRKFIRVLRKAQIEKENQIEGLITLSGQLEKSQEGIETDPKVNSLFKSHDGSCWVGTTQGLIQFRNPASSKPEPERPVLQNQSVTAITDDEKGGMWAGTASGHLWWRPENSWRDITIRSMHHPISAMLPNGEGGIWVGTIGGGLNLFGGTNPSHFGKETPGLESDSILSLYRDTNDILWIGTSGGGLSRYGAGKFQNFTTREGLPDNTISQILESSDGKLWLGSDKGVASIHRADVMDFLEGRSRLLHPQVFGHADGMPSEKCSGGFYPAGLRTKTGELFFATDKGIAMLDPKLMPQEPKLPNIIIEGIVIDGEPGNQMNIRSRGMMPGENYVLNIPAGKHRIEFRYTALGFNQPEQVRFRYRLDGLDSDWVEAGENGTRRTASYGYVPPGTYTFTVDACFSSGIWSTNGAVIQLKVASYFWQTWWFICLAAVAVLTMIVVAVRFQEKAKVHRRLNILEQERALQRERARIAQDLHDDLGSSLTRISLLSGLAKADKDNPDLLETHTHRISQSAEQTVRALEEIVWAVRPESDSLQSLVEYISHFANELFEGDAARCRLDLPTGFPPRPLPPDLRHDIFLVVKEALTNALKHAQAKEVRIQARINGDQLEVVVQDDGMGFNTSGISADSIHNGLGNMRRRTTNMKGVLTVNSTPGKGTQVRLSIQIPEGSDES